MENKELLQKLNFLIKELNDTHNRLQRANANLQEIESALLTQQVVNLYQHLQRIQDSYRKARLKSASTLQTPEKEKTTFTQQEIKPNPGPQNTFSTGQVQQESPVTEPVKTEVTPVSEIYRQEIKTEQPIVQTEQKKEETKAEINPEPLPQQPVQEPAKQPTFNFSTASSRVEQSPEQKPTDVQQNQPQTEVSPKTKPEIEIQTPEAHVTTQPITDKPEPITTEIEPKQQFYSAQSAPEKQENQSINERFAQHHVKKNLADKLKLSPIKDIKSAMSLNQRISFIKNLFKGNDEDFIKTVSFINNLKNFNEAKFYIQSEVNNKYNWEEENPLVQEFMELVYRKFL